MNMAEGKFIGQAEDNPEAVITEILQQIHAMGANDGEYTAVNGVLEKLRAGQSKPAEAVAEARKILASKQDYH